ncbi:unnamed protein product [Ophioblennius macclurei]
MRLLGFLLFTFFLLQLSESLPVPVGNHTLLRSRECILEGSQLHCTDCVFYDGKVYLTLNHSAVWTAQVPQALPLKEVWDREVQSLGTEREHLREACFQLMKELKLSEAQSDSVGDFPLLLILIPVLVLVICAVTATTVFISKKKGLRHLGGVTGSIIHYPKDWTAETDPEEKGYSYQTL